jgi:hypothetical protein
MTGPLIRAIAIAALGAIGGAACVAGAYAFRPAFTLEMDAELPRNVTGMYPPEYIPGGPSFAWTARSARVSLPGLDRRVPWACTVRLRGGRSAPLTQATVDVTVDGVPAANRVATNEFEDLEVPVPPSAQRRGLSLTIASSSAFIPGPGDPRELGVQIDRLTCRPADRAIALPPRRAYIAGMLAGAMFGAAFALIGITAGSAVGAVMLLVFAQAFPLSSGPGPFNSYADRIPWLALWIAAGMVAAAKLLERHRVPPLRQTARFVIAFSAAALYLKLLALLHPAKPLVDAVFQAHRLQWVLDGRYYFTQLMPSGVQFPYAIGLYVFAAPWTALTRDYVSLLRIVVCVMECVAGATLYPAIVRTWGDRLGGAIAVALFAVIPTSWWVIGNANLTNAFGQSVALLAVTLVIIGSLQGAGLRHLAIWTLVIALALLSHVSTLATLGLTLVLIAVLFWFSGTPVLRSAGRTVLLATALAGIFSVAIYYGHFTDVYLNALKVRGGATTTAAPPAGDPAPAVPDRQRVPPGPLVRFERSAEVVGSAIGVPIVALAAAGVWLVGRRRSRDPLTLALIAWGVTFVLFFGAALMRVESQFQRYSLEFVQRVAFAASPAFVVLAAAAAAWGWRSGTWRRGIAALILGLAMAIGLREWAAWW